MEMVKLLLLVLLKVILVTGQGKKNEGKNEAYIQNFRNIYLVVFIEIKK